MHHTQNEPPTRPGARRWIQLVVGILCMALVANLQYSWTLFVNPMSHTMGWDKAAIQVAFSIFVIIETWFGPIEGIFVDRFGPRPVVAFGAICVFLAWTIYAHAASLSELYFGAVLAGLGGGCVYGTCVGNALKWFPEKRGFASGLTATGFGAGAALTVIPIAHAIHNSGYKSAFATYAVILGGALLILSFFLARPATNLKLPPVTRITQGKRDYTLREMLKTPVFWMLYLVFTIICAGGLIATAQIAPIARDFGFAQLPIGIFGATLPLLTVTLSLDSLVNGLTRPFSGLLSDWIGRENVMFLVFLGEGLALLGLVKFGHHPTAFLIFAPCIFLFWGEIYAISSAIIGDTYGSRYITANAGALYTTKGVAVLLVPLGSWIRAETGSWNMVFIACAVASIAVALLSKFVIAPMRKSFIERSNVAFDAKDEAQALKSSSNIPVQIGG